MEPTHQHVSNLSSYAPGKSTTTTPSLNPAVLPVAVGAAVRALPLDASVATSCPWRLAVLLRVDTTSESLMRSLPQCLLIGNERCLLNLSETCHEELLHVHTRKHEAAHRRHGGETIDLHSGDAVEDGEPVVQHE